MLVVAVAAYEADDAVTTADWRYASELCCSSSTVRRVLTPPTEAVTALDVRAA